MKHHSLLMSGAMVRQTLNGSKTMTRRMLKSPTDTARWAKGDLLYVREAWRTSASLDPVKPSSLAQGTRVSYEASDNAPASVLRGKLRPGMFMPRWASRLTLQVEDVSYERLQDITEDDALAEGIVENKVIVGAACHGGRHIELTGIRYFNPAGHPHDEGHEDAISAFKDLWTGINGEESWEENPYVSVTTFKTFHCNIDQWRPENVT